MKVLSKTDKSLVSPLTIFHDDKACNVLYVTLGNEHITSDVLNSIKSTFSKLPIHLYTNAKVERSHKGVRVHTVALYEYNKVLAGFKLSLKS